MRCNLRLLYIYVHYERSKKGMKLMMKKKVIFCTIVVMLIAFTTICVFASTEYVMTYYPGTSDEVTNLPETESQTTDQEYSVSSQIPEREGYEFLGWVLDYKEIKYTVKYVVQPDPIFGTPTDSTTPIDSKEYTPGETVHVAELLNSTQDYAYKYAISSDGNKRSGTWTFTWNKEDFQIDEDITIKGSWTFTPNPTKYKYTVHYVLFDNMETIVADDLVDGVDELGVTVTEPAKTRNELKAKYRKNYQPVPGYGSVTREIYKDDYEIYIYYQKKSSSS